MIQYRLSQKFPQDSFLQVEMKFKPESSNFEIKLPEWRPGRYQLGNFSKNLRNLKVFNEKGINQKYKKTDRSSWEINLDGDSCVVRYEIFTSVIDGGSTFVNEEQWYINFINCMLYYPESMNNPHHIELEIPEDWTVACSLEKQNHKLIATSFYELVDSPMIAAKNMQHLEYELEGKNFHLWFRGKANIENEEKILADFKSFTALQMQTMGEFESSDYHFLYQITDEKAYHGVEHLNSTCIVLGPAKEFNTEKFYDNFLGISSHELFHYWNIIRIRPQEMYPYKFDQENYFTTGYIAEGVTTYYGDLFLVRSGVKNLDWYLNELNQLFKRHFENYGRFNYSVAESSWDLWIDGYEPGIPHRKVSIYVKGALISLILDLKIILKTHAEKSFDDVLRKLWIDTYKRKKGYTPEEYLEIAEKIIGENLSDYSRKYIDGCEPIENELRDLLDCFGFKLERKANENELAKYFGVKISENKVIALAPDSPGEKVLRLGDQIVSTENEKFDEESDSLQIERNKQYHLQIFRDNLLKNVKMDSGNADYYYTYEIKVKDATSEDELKLRKKWLNI